MIPPSNVDVDFKRLDVRDFRTRLNRLVFGDGLGVIIFLGALVYFGLYWRIGVFVTDNWTLVNTLAAVADGHLHLDAIVSGPVRANTPGRHVVDGKVYGRNYGQIFLALPFYGALEALAFVTDIRIAIAGTWSILILAFSVRVGRQIDRGWAFAVMGSTAALTALAVNVHFAFPLSVDDRYLVALQVSTMVFAALIGVIVYRVLAAIYDPRIGGFAGAATVLATPVGFWASIPKRHVLISLLAVVALYGFYLSRSHRSDDIALRARCASYACVGLTAWVHAPEALALFVVLAPLDLATARSNVPRRLAVVMGVFFLALVPFFLTNLLVAGNPLVPPRSLSSGPLIVAGTDANTGSPGGPTVDNGNVPLSEAFVTGVAIVSSSIAAASMFSDLILNGIGVVYHEPSRLVRTFVRSNPVGGRATANDLSLLEATPVFGVFIALPLLIAHRLDRSRLGLILPTSPIRQTDVFAVAYVLVLSLLYIHRLPLHATWTVRYLLPIVPFGMYFVGRYAPLRRTVNADGELLKYAYATSVLVGGQLVVVFLVMLAPTVGEAIRFHAILGVSTAGVASVWALGTELEYIDDTRIGAVVLAVALASGTLFVLLSGIEYFGVMDFGLAMVELLSEAIPIA